MVQSADGVQNAARPAILPVLARTKHGRCSEALQAVRKNKRCSKARDLTWRQTRTGMYILSATATRSNLLSDGTWECDKAQEGPTLYAYLELISAALD